MHMALFSEHIHALPGPALAGNWEQRWFVETGGATSTSSSVHVATGAEEKEYKYRGLTSMTFKKRFINHQMSMRDRDYSNSMALSRHV